jgi:GNAT superfamily N-acetyltransferase
VRVSYLKDRPELASQLIPHENYDSLPMAWIAHDGDVAVGTSALRLYDHPDRKDLSPWLGGMYVEPHVRRQGIGAQLAQVVERKAVELGYSRLHLFTYGQEHFYAEQGWTYMEPTEWRGLKCSIMWRLPRAA